MNFRKIVIITILLLNSSVLIFAQADTWLEKGQKSMFQKKYNDAVTYYSKAIQIDSSKINAFYNRGLAYLYLDKFEEAIQDFNYLIQIDSSSVDAFNNRGLALGYVGKVPEAINDFSKAISIDSNFSMAYFNLGNAYMSMNQDNDALKNFSKSISIDSSNPGVFFQRGTIYYSQGDYSKALYDFSKAISMGFRPPKAYYNLGNAYYRLEKYDKAIKNYNEVLRLDSNDVEALNNRAMAYDQLGQKSKAEADRKKLQKIYGKVTSNIPVDSLKFKTYSTDSKSYSIELPENWYVVKFDSTDIDDMIISPDPLKNYGDPFYTGVHISLNLNMGKHWGKSDPEDLLEFWKGSVGKNIDEYFVYRKFTEKYFNRFGYTGLMTNIQIQTKEKSLPLVLYEYVLAKENTLFFAYFQASASEFGYYQKIFDKAIQSLILK